MLNKQIMKKLENMLEHLSPSQRERLNHLVQNEDSLKQAVKSIDPQKAKQAVENLGIRGTESVDVDKILRDVQKQD